MAKIDRDLIRSVPLFSSISEDNLASLMAAAKVREVRAGTVLFTEGKRVENLYILVRGAAELFCEYQGRRFTIAVVREARPLAVSCIMAGSKPLTARVLEPAEVIVVPTRLIVELIGRDLGLADAVVRELAYESLQNIQHFMSQRLLTATERIAHWMLCSDASGGGTGKIVIPFDKRVLASYLGMAPEQLSRGFSTLGSAGVVVEGRCITLTDRAALAEVAGIGAQIIPDPSARSHA